MRLGIDLDDTTADFKAGFAEAYEKSFGVLINSDDIITWESLVKQTHFATDKEMWQWIEKEHPEIFHNLWPIPGAIDVLNELKLDGHELVFITCKPAWANTSPAYWLNKYTIPYNEIHVKGFEINAPCVKYDIQCDIYFDDSPHQLANLRTKTDAMVVRMIQPWNRPIPGVFDVETWDEFLQLVKKHDALNRLIEQISK